MTAPEPLSEVDLEKVRKFCQKQLGWEVEVQKIKALKLRDADNHVGDAPRIEVGQTIREGETVLAIFKSNAYLVCTYSRGVATGMPYLYGEDEVLGIE